MTHSRPRPDLTLCEVLRRRRELPLEEVARLVEKLPNAAEAPDEAGEWINALFVRWETGTGGEAGDWAGRSVREWPAFSLRWRRRWEEAEGEDSGATMATVLPRAAGRVTGAPAQLALLIYELLGGAHRASSERALSPLAALDEEANAVLRRAVRGEFADCERFLRAWERAVAGQLSATGKGLPFQAWQIPRWVRHAAQPGDALRLAPEGDAGAAIHLVARRQFRIGRSRGQSDLPVRMWREDGREDVEASTQISRLHVLAELGPEGPTLRDGNGAQPSANGSAFDGVPLDALHPLPLRSRGELTLSSCASVELRPIPRSELSELAIPGAEHAPGQPPEIACPIGAVAAAQMPGSRAVLLREAVWLFSEIGGELGPGGAVRWLPASAARFAFLRRGGAFWIANLRAQSSEVRLDDAILSPGQIAPLSSGRLLDLGATRLVVMIG